MQLNADSVSERENRHAYSGDRWRHSHAMMGQDGSATIDLEPIPEKSRNTTIASISGLFGGSDRPPAQPELPEDALGYEVQLASYYSHDHARRGWKRLSEAAPSLLGDVEHQVKKAEIDGETIYRLRTEPMADKTDAVRLCRKLREHDIECLVFALY